MQPQPAYQEPITMPGFTAEETATFLASLRATITAAVNEAFDKHFGPLPPLQQQQSTQQATQATQHSIPPTPQAQKEEGEQQAIAREPQPRYQATVEDAEDDAETTPESTKYGSTKPDSKSTLSSMPCLCTTRSSGNSAACLSNALLSADQHASFLASLLASQFGYIECMEGMEASGEG